MVVSGGFLSAVEFCVSNFSKPFFMNDNQQAQWAACTRFKNSLGAHNTEVATIPEAAPELTIFNNNYNTVAAAWQAQSLPLGTSVDAVEVAKNTMATVVIKYSLRGSIKAKQAGNLSLYKKLNESMSYLLFATKGEAVTRANEMKQLIIDNATIITNVTPAQVTEMTTAIKAYDVMKEVPMQEVQNRSTQGTKIIEDALKLMMTAMDDIYDLIYSYFNDTKHAMVLEFAADKKIIQTGVHYTGIEGMITENGQPVENATVSEDGTTKKATSDIMGHYSLTKLVAGNHHFTVTLPSGATKAVILHLVKGHIETYNFDF